MGAQSAERRCRDARAGHPSHPRCPSWSCLPPATAAAVATSSVQPSSHLTQTQPDSRTWGQLRRAPPVLLRSMACPQKPAWGTQLHTPKGWALTARRRSGLLGWEGAPPRLQAGSPERAPQTPSEGPRAVCATTRPALLGPRPCLSLRPTPMLPEHVHKPPASKTLAPVLL